MWGLQYWFVEIMWALKTTDFINNMFSLGLYPLILKPSRITKDSATLIDNIFINITKKTVKSVFAVFKHKLKINKVCDYKLQRVRTLETI